MPQRADLPTGTVTFLFTDIEGSTRLLDRLGEAYPAVLEAHQRILRDAFAARGGIDVSTEGDSFFVVFPAAAQAVAAAAEAQRALGAHGWPVDGEVRVRMGLHTGDGLLGGDNYVGVDLHRASRIASAGHGGQIVASDATRALVEPTAPEGLTFRDLGEHRLKDLPHPERLYQVVDEGLPADFPALRSMDARPNNLPVQLTSFVGRRRELDEVEEGVRRGRLLTLTGPGGTGKTRLALQAAMELLSEFEDGAFFVGLAPITDPSLVMPSISHALGLPEATERTPAEGVTEHLRDKELLLVMDNFEQVLDAAPEVGQLLTMTERVRVLATSREPLGLSGEREYPVPPLGLPDPAHLPSLDGLSRFEAVALFVERATAVRPDFQVTNENAAAVAEICARLDGLPLAIELAAARVKILTPQAMLARLEKALTFLAGGSRYLPQRQRTLRDAIAWSFDLLEEEERRLFARLSVFVGGFSLEGAETICNRDGELGLDTFEGIASLTNKSLLRQMVAGPDEPRFFMLVMIREYAGERLAGEADAGEIARRHKAFFLELAERAEPELTGRNQERWLDALSAEHDNLRAALHRAAEGGELETALRLGGALWRFWQMRGHLREGSERLSRLLELPGAADHPEALAKALEAAGSIVYWMADFPAARSFYERALEIHRRLGNTRGVAEQLYNVTFTYRLPPPPLTDLAKAQQLLEESLALFRDIGDEQGVAKVLWGLGNVRLIHGDADGALASSRESLELGRKLGDRYGQTWSLWLVGASALDSGDLVLASLSLREALRMLEEVGDTSGVPIILSELAAVAMTGGDAAHAVRLQAAAESVEDSIGTGLGRATSRREERARAVRNLVGDKDLAGVWDEGQAMTVEEAVAYALEEAADRGQASTP